MIVTKVGSQDILDDFGYVLESGLRCCAERRVDGNVVLREEQNP